MLGERGSRKQALNHPCACYRSDHILLGCGMHTRVVADAASAAARGADAVGSIAIVTSH
jgi:hypothetical protein